MCAKKSESSLPPMPPEVEAYLREVGKAAAGRSLSEALRPDQALGQMMGRALEIALEEEMSAHLGYAPHQRVQPDEGQPSRRANTRNGSSSKRVRSQFGEVAIEVPRDRHASFEPHIVPKHASVTQEIADRVVLMYATQTQEQIRAHLAQIYNLQVDDSFISRLVARVDPELKAWRNRPLEAVYPVLFVDALHLKMRHADGVRATALYTVCSYGESGRLQVLGLHVAPEGFAAGESAAFWHQVFLSLQGRGLAQPLIVCGDGLAGLEQALAAVYPQARFQPCVVHLLRASFRQASYRDRKALASALRTVYKAPTYEAAELALAQVGAQWGARLPGVVAQWEGHLVALKDLWSYGAALRKLVYTTNPIENVHRQVRQATKTRGALPNPESALRLVTLVLQRVDEAHAHREQARPDWRAIVNELHIHFGDRLPRDWGYRMCAT